VSESCDVSPRTSPFLGFALLSLREHKQEGGLEGGVSGVCVMCEKGSRRIGSLIDISFSYTLSHS
jgi:hypothetical protein